MEENNKAASRNVPAINQFLDEWERRCVQFYLDAYQKYIVAKGEMKDEYRRMGEKLEELGRRAQWDKEDPNYEAYHALDKERDRLWKEFHQEWNYVIQFLDHSKPYEEYMRHVVAEEKKRICERYLKELNNDKIELPKIREGATHIWHQFVIRCKDRDGLMKYLDDKGIGTIIHYPIPPHLSEAYQYLGIKEGSFLLQV